MRDAKHLGGHWWRVVLLTSLVMLGVVASAGWRAVAGHRPDVASVAVPPTGYDAQDHFPGAALLYADVAPPPPPERVELAAPAPGTTGTVAPPPEPVLADATADAADAALVPAARPFAMAGASSLDRGRALECLTAAIWYEAGNQGADGERAVAQVVLNRVRHPAFPASVCGVVYQGTARAAEGRGGCQFSFACDGSMARVPSRGGWAGAMRVAADALAGRVYAPVGLATHYHTYAVTPVWNRALVMTAAIGAHFFHRWKGFWGTPAAFRQVWGGHEPEPGPLRPAETPPSAPLFPPTIAIVAPVTPQAAIVPAHRDSGTAITPPAAPTLPDSQVLDRWKDSGKPLR